MWSNKILQSAKPHSSLLGKVLRILFCPGFWKHIQNKELSYIYIHTFHPRSWIFLVLLSQFMALGLLAPSQGLGELPQHLFFPLKNLIIIMQAVVLKPVPTLQIRRSQHTFT